MQLKTTAGPNAREGDEVELVIRGTAVKSVNYLGQFRVRGLLPVADLNGYSLNRLTELHA